MYNNLVQYSMVGSIEIWLHVVFVLGLVYLPEIMYRRILNQSFGPGGWGLMPRGEIIYQVS